MERTGLLREITGQARTRVYQADEVLAVLEESIEEPEGPTLGEVL